MQLAFDAITDLLVWLSGKGNAADSKLDLCKMATSCLENCAQNVCRPLVLQTSEACCSRSDCKVMRSSAHTQGMPLDSLCGDERLDCETIYDSSEHPASH